MIFSRRGIWNVKNNFVCRMLKKPGSHLSRPTRAKTRPFPGFVWNYGTPLPRDHGDAQQVGATYSPQPTPSTYQWGRAYRGRLSVGRMKWRYACDILFARDLASGKSGSFGQSPCLGRRSVGECDNTWVGRV